MIISLICIWCTMNFAQTSQQFLRWLPLSQFKLTYKRLFLPILMIAFVCDPNTQELTLNTLSDAFWAVSAYVAFTLAIYHYVSKLMESQKEWVRLYQESSTSQIVCAALLGALPGCGGAIIVATQFVSGKVGFGALVAVLTATMGDAAFLLLASEPKVGIGVVVLGVIVGAITGLIVHRVHREDYLRPEVKQTMSHLCCDQPHNHQNVLEAKIINIQGTFWKWLLVPAFAIALMGSFQIDINALFHLPELGIEWIGSILIIVSMLIWSMTKEVKDYQSTVAEDAKIYTSHPLQKAAQDTNFITAWVVISFMAFQLVSSSYGVNYESLLSDWMILMPLAGLAIGLLPGCGPQILVTSLYLSGAVPLSAQLANAISNDGDALFPAIALAPKAALVATFYSAIPAFIVGYGYYFLFEI